MNTPIHLLDHNYCSTFHRPEDFTPAGSTASAQECCDAPAVQLPDFQPTDPAETVVSPHTPPAVSDIHLNSSVSMFAVPTTSAATTEAPDLREQDPQTSGTKRHRTEDDTTPETSTKRIRGDQDAEDQPHSSHQEPISANERRAVQGDQEDEDQPNTSQQESISANERRAFYRLLSDPLIKPFLKSDKRLKMSDKYLLAMVQIYFKRALLTVEEYTVLNFYSALFIANKIEEDDTYYYCIYLTIKKFMGIADFKTATIEFFWRMGLRGWVSLEECHKVMDGQHHKVWKRERKAPLDGHQG